MPSRPKRPPGETRRLVAELLRDDLSYAEVARRLGIPKPTVSFHAHALGLVPHAAFARRYDWDAVRQAYDAGASMNACIARFGFSRNAWFDAVSRGAIVPRDHREPIEDVLALGRRRNRGHVKARLLRAGLKQATCEICGLDSWRGAALSLQLHHINGDGLDNRLENLQLLCPNCHSQTETWGGRNSGRRSSSRLSQERRSE